MSKRIQIPVSPGEILDKLSILDIKLDRIDDPGKLANVRREHELLSGVWAEVGLETDEIAALRGRLLEVNQRLWQIEDDIRDCERDKNFGNRFVSLARSVYIENDERAAIKKEINQALGSDIVEEKSYADYR
jgi:hypothetical protein